MIRSFPPHPNPLPYLRRSGFAQAGPRGEGRPFIPPAELGGILAYFDKISAKAGIQESTGFPRIMYGVGLVKPGMTNRLKFMSSCIVKKVAP